MPQQLATGKHKVGVADMQSLKTIAKAGPVHYPDGIAYAPGPKRVFVSDEHGDSFREPPPECDRSPSRKPHYLHRHGEEFE